jgi:DNA repair photolyase
VQEHVEGIDDWELKPRTTEYIYDNSRTLVNEVTSPDVGMMYSANPYQGCEHGCIYCYARNSHEYWGYSAGLDFESRIVVKKNAPQLLQKFFENKNWQPTTISLSGNTDCYQPIERKMRITRQLLEICLEFRNPVGILTKNALVLRDLDILQELNKHQLVSVFSSITSLDEDLRRVMEPRTASYRSRLKVVETLAKNNIPTGIMNAPIIPGLNDTHMHDVLKAASEVGARWAGYTVVRLNGAIGNIFKDWVHKAFPDRAEKIWNLISSCHEGHVNDSRWGNRIVGDGKWAELIKDQFKLYCKI